MLTRTGEYALQALVYLAQHEEEWPIPGPRIAEQIGLPRKYLSAILAALVRNGVLDSSRGKGGGFLMARSPKETRLFDVLAPFEPVLADRRPCPFGNPVCNDDDPCAGHDRWKGVREAFYKFVHDTSVHDVATRQGVPKRKRKRKGAKPRR